MKYNWYACEIYIKLHKYIMKLYDYLHTITARIIVKRKFAPLSGRCCGGHSVALCLPLCLPLAALCLPLRSTVFAAA